MRWTVSMKDEKDGKNVVLTEGIHEAKIVSVELVPAEKSGTGRPYFRWNFETSEGTVEAVTTLLKKKRWLLKQTLSACGIEANSEDEEQKYSFSEAEVLGKKIWIKVATDSKPFTARDGSLITSPKSKVLQVMKEPPPTLEILRKREEKSESSSAKTETVADTLKRYEETEADVPF